MIRRFIRSRLTLGAQRALRQLLFELKIWRHHHAGVAKARGLRAPIKLHLGCGTSLKAGWVNVDLFEPGADLALDLREPLPFADGSVSIVHSEHFLEHLEYVPNDVARLLREAYRVLSPGGVLSVGVPDAAPHMAAYARGDTAFFGGAWNPSYPEWLRVPMHRINYLFRQFGEHKYAYDEEILTGALREAGFADVRRREFNPELDLESRRDGTLYVSGTKPASPAPGPSSRRATHVPPP